MHLYHQPRTFAASQPPHCRYLPLELLNSVYRWLDKADMFALGATLFELASRNELPSGGQLYQDLRHGKVHPPPAALQHAS